MGSDEGRRIAGATPELQEAITDALIGGNHLASVLIHECGTGYPAYTSSVGDARVWFELRHGLAWIRWYDVWCAWRALMRLRDAVEAGRASDARDAEVRGRRQMREEAAKAIHALLAYCYDETCGNCDQCGYHEAYNEAVADAERDVRALPDEADRGSEAEPKEA